MISEIGHFLLSLALIIATLLGGLALISQMFLRKTSLLSEHLQSPQTSSFPPHNLSSILLRTATCNAQILFWALLGSFICLILLFAQNDFATLLVAEHSSLELPLAYKISATWGSHEGSILLWILILSGWTALVSHFSKSLDTKFRITLLGILGALSTGMVGFVLFTSNPFIQQIPTPLNGKDLNPMLQDPVMIIHPPLLYLGYVGLSIGFAFCVTGLIHGHFLSAAIRWIRPWILTAWAFLTIGITLGSFWAYYELGWGGWWFWDPVENASFMPWLCSTALLHSLSVTEKRGSLISWTVLLGILSFALSLLGTFLVRSGVLTSVHAFANDPSRGVFILIFLAIIIGGSLILFAWRAPHLKNGPGFGFASRESFLLANNVLLLTALSAVLLGTLYPLVLDSLDMGKISVGPPYFETIFLPIMAPALFLIGVAPVSRWKKAKKPALSTKLSWAFAVSIITAITSQLVASPTPELTLTSLGLSLAFWITASVGITSFDALKDTQTSTIKLHKIFSCSKSFWGMQLAHLGVAILVAGISLTRGYEKHTEQSMRIGDTISLNSYTLKFTGIETESGPNYQTLRGNFDIYESNRKISELSPERRLYSTNGAIMSETSIYRSLTSDLYITMSPGASFQEWIIRAYIKPFINLIWSGALIIAAGGFLSVLDRRYRKTHCTKP